MKSRFGWSFPDADEQMLRELAPDGTYQGSHVTAALKHVTDRSLAVDCGAHVGTWSRLLSATFQRVIAIEPSLDTCEALRVNMAAFACANVEIRQVAVGAEPGTVSMVLSAPAAALKNTGARFVRTGGDIPRITIDSLQLPSLGFLKMDIEGSESLALEGAAETLKRCRPIVLFENKWLWTKNLGLPKQAVRDFLIRKRYRFLEQISHDQIWGPR